MLDGGILILDWLGIVVFATTGALVASRQQMDAVGFVLLSIVTGIGGGTLRDLLLDIRPILWIEQPAYLIVCAVVGLIMFFTAHLVTKRYVLILWLDAVGLAVFSIAGAERALNAGASPVVAVAMGTITATFGGVIRDVLSHQQSIIFSREIYVTAAMSGAFLFVTLNHFTHDRAIAIIASLLIAFGLRAGALRWGWQLPRYHPTPPRTHL